MTDRIADDLSSQLLALPLVSAACTQQKQSSSELRL
eukprot:CAMPEP_0185201060 /NCGR_PEP_ID=MMETSP1140-20130426/48518_1 /TAXON_ID=298111 /ORGANISM="Pavlova sp., Strain CCMP459" /LENGTH=35 /DNA_ID= /DNA_START= /DNA_END= /DNA_ORIENTATION=